jgi:L-rhamnonate dehydratase
MQIADVRAVEAADFGAPDYDEDDVRRPSWWEDLRVANPMTRYPRYEEVRGEWMPGFRGFGVVVEAEDAAAGYAPGNHGTPVAALVDDYLGERITGENAMATEKIHDMLERLCAPFGAQGLASFAVSAIDLALWDLKGKLLDLPVYELLGGPAKDGLDCYATGNDTDWYLELGFDANKLACPYGPADGKEGLLGNEELVADRRELLGEGRELMLDCWMAFDEEYTVRLANRLREYDLKWMEETLWPVDYDSHARVRDRLPFQTLATGEHWYTKRPFQYAANHDLVDIFQPDIHWVGGLTTVQKIATIAESSDTSVILHCGGGTPYGQHASYGLPGIRWTEYPVTAPPGVSLEAAETRPGVAVPEDGTLVPNDAPGFGVEFDPGRLDPFEF